VEPDRLVEEEVITAGIDFSTFKINLIVLNDGQASRWVYQVPAKSGDAFDRARLVKLVMPDVDFWARRQVAALAIEEPRGPGNGALLRVQGAILACLPHDLLVQPMIPAEWRKKAGLPGNCPKDRVREHVESLDWRARNWMQDDCDAYCLALAVRQLVKEAA
jgi:hypothetical protein